MLASVCLAGAAYTTPSELASERYTAGLHPHNIPDIDFLDHYRDGESAKQKLGFNQSSGSQIYVA